MASFFWKPEAFDQTVLPDRSVLIGQKLVKMPKLKNSNATFWVFFKESSLSSSTVPWSNKGFANSPLQMHIQMIHGLYCIAAAVRGCTTDCFDTSLQWWTSLN